MNFYSKAIIKVILKSFGVISGFFFSCLSLLLSFTTWSEIGINDLGKKIIIILSILFCSLVLAILYETCIRHKNIILQNGESQLLIRYGDITKIGFPKKRKRKSKRIVVIPVNTAFDTIVDIDLSNCLHPVVSPYTIHGKWISKMQEEGYTDEILNDIIQDSLTSRGYQYEKYVEKDRGNNLCYPYGTIVPLSDENTGVTFWLLAVAEFDSANNAQSSPDMISYCFDRLIDYIDSNSQGFELYLPLIGSGYSRASLSPEQALLLAKCKLLLNSNKLHGPVNIVVYKKIRNQVAIT